MIADCGRGSKGEGAEGELWWVKWVEVARKGRKGRREGGGRDSVVPCCKFYIISRHIAAMKHRAY